MLLDELIKEEKRIARLKEQVVRCLEQSPEGALRISKRGSYAYYYHRKEGAPPGGEYIPRRKRALAERLASKDYAAKLLSRLQREESCLNDLIAACYPSLEIKSGVPDLGQSVTPADCVEAVYRGLSEDRQQLVIPFEEPADDYVKTWLAGPQCEKGFYEGDPLLYSDKGERMRSKSEVLIANKLFHADVPYRYESAFYLEGEGVVYPDFLVLNKRSRECFVWEHLGMMDDGSYAQKALMKVEAYGRCGYLPGLNLILTHERSRYPLDTRVVDGLIKGKLM